MGTNSDVLPEVRRHEPADARAADNAPSTIRVDLPMVREEISKNG
jgi:hypothetical protein